MKHYENIRFILISSLCLRSSYLRRLYNEEIAADEPDKEYLRSLESERRAAVRLLRIVVRRM